MLALALTLVGVLAAGPAGALARRTAGRTASRASWFLRQDRVMHRATPARPLARAQKARRYTSWTEARREMKLGVPPNAHLTPRAGVGRPPVPSTVKRDLGLRRAPTGQLDILVPRGQPVRKGRVWADSRRRWEWASPKALPPTSVRSIRRLWNSGRKP